MSSKQSKKCPKCGGTFYRHAKHSHKQWANAKTCSRKCGPMKRDPSRDAMMTRDYQDGMTCAEIGVKHSLSGKQVSRILKQCGVAVSPWRSRNGGLAVTKQGYLRFSDSKLNGSHAGRKVHCLIAEMKMGRRLRREEVVHHLDGDKLNNHPNNLKVMTRGEHTTLHLWTEGKNA